MYFKLSIILSFLPGLRAGSTAIEDGCWFVSRAGLNFTEISFVVAAVRARDLGFLNVFPGFFSTENVVDLFLLESYFLGKPSID